MDNDRLLFIKAEIKKYFFEKSKIPYVDNLRQNNALLKAAELCIALDAEPKTFVTTIVNHYSDSMQLNFLHGDAAKKIYETYMSLSGLSYDELYTVQKTYIKNQIMRLGRTLDKILLDDDLNLHPWFRICISKDEIPEVTAKYIEEAKQLMTPALLSFLKTKELDYTRITND